MGPFANLVEAQIAQMAMKLPSLAHVIVRFPKQREKAAA
jgi:hypothetical protein